MNRKTILQEDRWVEVREETYELKPLVLRPNKGTNVTVTYQGGSANRQIDVGKITQLVNRKLCDINQTLMSEVSYLEHYGRIVLVKCVPIQMYDPIIAVPLVQMTGWSKIVHDRAYRVLMDRLMMIDERMVWNFNAWYRSTRRQVNKIIKHSQQFMRPDEWEYYSQQMWESLANPQRKIGK